VRVAELWRYPVKSLQGERLDSAEVTEEGLEGDRRFAIFDVESGLGLTARRQPELLFASARLLEPGVVEIVLPDGSRARGDDDLSDWLGRRVALLAVDGAEARRYENVVDFEHEPTSPWEQFVGADGPFHDNAGVRVSLVSTATLGAWDRRRFRPNVVLAGGGEDGLVGSGVRLGGATLAVTTRITRCVMTTRPQPGLERDLDVLRTVARERHACLAIGALVTAPGAVSVGDELAAA
jgi:uncharacterized protein YcbX